MSVLVSKKQLLLWVVFVTGFLSVQAQNTPLSNVTIASPQAASLGKYADIPVSYHTGIPDITIPIYTINEGPLTVPISFSYQGGGMKVMEPSSSVGTGWALNAGGVITRTVRGAPDDRDLNSAVTKYGHFHDYGYNSYLYTPTKDFCGDPPCPIGASHPADDEQFASGILDGEPDLFFFNFNGYTGKFYFNDDRTPVLVPQQDLKIEPILADESSTVAYISMLGFVITTPDGTKFYFGKNQQADGHIDAIETTGSMNTHTTAITSQGAVSSWFLTKIASADDQFSVKFIYQPEKYSYYTLSMFPIWNIDNDGTWHNYYGTYEYDLAKNFISGVRLQQIVFSNGTVNFNTGFIRNDVGDFYFKAITDQPNNEAASLGSITINGPDNFCKKFTLSQSYFFDNRTSLNGFFTNSYTIQSDRYRLRLDAIQEQSCDGSITVPPYRFDYYTEDGTLHSGIADFAPRQLSFAQDHWGFYNGAVNNTSLVPTYFLNDVPVPGADRDPHWPAMRTGALKRVTYPMGGYTDLDYEANDTYGTIFSTITSPALTLSCGFDGSSSGQSTVTLEVNKYQIDLSNSSAGGGSSIYIEDASHNSVFNLYADPGKTATGFFTPSGGTYTVHISKDNPASGAGTTVNFTEWIPSNTTGNIMIGGLRIKTITKNDGFTNNNIVTNYSYTVTGGTQSSGILYSRPVYVSLMRNDIAKLTGGSPSTTLCSQNGCAFCDASTGQAYYKSGGAIFPMENTQGNHIGYNEVKVSQTGNGYSIYRYYGSNIWTTINSDIVTRRVYNTTCDAGAANFPAAPVPFEAKRGDLKYEGHFSESGKAIKEAYYNPQYEADKITTPGYIVTYLGGLNNMEWGTEYNIQSYRKTSMETITYTTDPATGNYISNTTREYYGSLFHNKPTRQEKIASTGDVLAATTKYAMDFRISACDNISDGWDNYVSAYNAAASTFSSSLNCTSGVWNCRWLAYQQFRFDRSNARQNYVSYRRTNFTDPGNSFSVNHANAKNSADAILKPILELQDEFKNEAVEVTTWRGNLMTGSTFTNFGYAANPSTKVYPVKTRLLNVYTPSTGFTNAATSSNNQSIITDSRYLDEATYNFSKGNIIEGTPKDGVTIAYLWGYPNNYPIAKITNAHNNEAAYTSFENDGPEGNWTISDNSRNTTNEITGHKSYDLSSGKSVTAAIPSGKQYLVSYWSLNGAATVSANGTPVSANATGLSKNGWTYYEHILPNTTTNVVVTGLNVTIDELRLYPVDAEMETCCYTPVVGMISACDKTNTLTYYEYDVLGRLIVVRDQDGNIVKTLKYNYKQ